MPPLRGWEFTNNFLIGYAFLRSDSAQTTEDRRTYNLNRLNVHNELLEAGDTRAVAGDVRVHGQNEKAALLVSNVELGLEHALHRVGVRQSAVGGAAEVGKVVHDPLDRQFDDAGRLTIQQ